MKPLRFGIKTAPQHTTYEDMLAVWQEADAIPAIEHAWLFDHLRRSTAMSTARASKDGRPSPPSPRDQTPPARSDGHRQHLSPSGGADQDRDRPSMSSPAGGSTSGSARAGTSTSIARWGSRSIAPGERIRRLDEACEIYKRLCTQHLTDFDGRYYQLKEARYEPKPMQTPYPPITIGGSGEKLTLRVVAKHADIWNFVGGTVETFQHKDRILREHCAAIGRDPEEIELSVQVRSTTTISSKTARHRAKLCRRRRDPPDPRPAPAVPRRDRHPAGRGGRAENSARQVTYPRGRSRRARFLPGAA